MEYSKLELTVSVSLEICLKFTKNYSFHTAEDSCTVYCKTQTGVKSRSWTFPDGTSCQLANTDIDDSFYCINGRCEKFSCNKTAENLFLIDPTFCPESLVQENEQKLNSVLQENR